MTRHPGEFTFWESLSGTILELAKVVMFPKYIVRGPRKEFYPRKECQYQISREAQKCYGYGIYMNNERGRHDNERG